MKQSKKCPKCGTKEILEFYEDTGRGGYGNAVRAGLLTIVPVYRCVCCACGYTEEYISKQDIPWLIEHYKK